MKNLFVLVNNTIPIETKKKQQQQNTHLNNCNLFLPNLAVINVYAQSGQLLISTLL